MQVATDALVAMEKAMKRDKIEVNDRQLACARIDSKEGREYLNGMAAAANFAWVNRSSMTFLARQAFAKMFDSTPDDLDMHVIYDVSHNIAKVEEHIVDGRRKKLLVHRKGSTRAFPPHHPLIPVDYQLTGQPVLIGQCGHKQQNLTLDPIYLIWQICQILKIFSFRTIMNTEQTVLIGPCLLFE